MASREGRRWEYKLFVQESSWGGYDVEAYERALDEYGSEGWEIAAVAIKPSNNDMCVTLKRQLDDDDEGDDDDDE